MAGKPEFVSSPDCQSRLHCHACRNLEGGRTWRGQLLRRFRLPNNIVDFICPWGVPWKNVAVTAGAKPAPTPRKVINFFEAMLKAGRVDDTLRMARSSDCLKCDLRRRDPKNGQDWCGACGCRVSADNRLIVNLTAYNEGPLEADGRPKWGCRHPQRRNQGVWTGKGWQH